MKRLQFVIGVLFCTCASAWAADGLIHNGAMESAKSGELPPHWQALNVGVPAEFATDEAEKHGGASSVRITAKEDARSYVRSVDPIPVAPGEEIRASAWVKAQNVPTDKGTVIFIAEFTDADGSNSTVAKFNTADLTKQGQWQLVQGSLTVPPRAANLHLRLGFSYSKGTCWWDDVTVTAVKPLVCRIDLDGPQLSPAMKTLPVAILNRAGREGQATLRVTQGTKPVDTPVTLSGQALQRVELPVKVGKPGKADIAVALVQDGNEVFADQRKVTIPPPLVLAPPSPTHWCIEDGPSVIDLRYEIALPEEQLENAALKVSIANTDLSADAEVRNGVGNVSFKGKVLPEGDYKVLAELRPRGGKPIIVEQPWHVIPRRLAKVTLNADGYPVYDGKAIFPLGIFNGGKFKEQADAGFTVTHAYNAVRLEEDPENADRNAFRYIENTHANGMKMLFMVPMKAAIAGDWDAIRRRVRMFRNHPGLLAWDEEEGFARGDFKPDRLKMLRQIIAEEDPNHPFMVGDSYDVITRMKPDRSDMFPADQMDLGMWWWYPLPFKAGAAGNALEGDEAAGVNEFVPPSFLVNATTKKPIWVGVQSYKKKDQRYPTPAEYRAQAYVALIHGAKGLMWYGGSVTGGLFLAPEEGHWDGLKKVVKELNELGPVFMSPAGPPPQVSPASAPISTCTRVHSKLGPYYFLVNRSAKPVNATITIGDNRREDSFEPFEVKIAR